MSRDVPDKQRGSMNPVERCVADAVRVAERRARRKQVLRSTGEILGGTLLRFLRGFRYGIYLLLLWMRPIVVGIAGLVVPITALAGVAWGFLNGWSSDPCLLLLGSSFSVFCLAFLYDTLLLIVAPEDIGLFS